MTQEHNVIGELLENPEVIAQVTPLINAAIDARIAPLTAQLEQLTRGVTLMAQATVEQAQGQPQPPQPVPVPSYQPPAAQYGPPEGIAPQAPPYQPPAPAQPAAVDKLAQFAPMLMNYLQGQNQGQNTNLNNIAETLSAAAQIGNFVNAPMWQGMKMATDMMSMSGRAGIDPQTAADTLGGMIDAQHPQQKNNGDGHPAT